MHDLQQRRQELDDHVGVVQGLARELRRDPAGDRPGAEAPAERIRKATEGRGVDVVLEAVGHASATALAYDLVAYGGTISAAGVHNEEHFAFSPGAAYDKNLTYKAGRAPARQYMEPMLDWIREDPTRFSSVVSHRLPLEEDVHAYDICDRKLEGCTKVLLVPGEA